MLLNVYIASVWKMRMFRVRLNAMILEVVCFRTSMFRARLLEETIKGSEWSNGGDV